MFKYFEEHKMNYTNQLNLHRTQLYSYKNIQSHINQIISGRYTYVHTYI